MKQPILSLSLILFLVACAPANRSLPTPLAIARGRTGVAGAESTTASTPILGIGSTRVSAKDGMRMVHVPAGEFRMGSADSQTDVEADTQPQHVVYLDSFWIDQTEVTNAMYSRCIAAGPCQVSAELVQDSRPEHVDYPVQGVTWEMARAYCEWAGRRLPSEAEWEKAARGADGRLYPWGNEPPDASHANFQPEIGTGSIGHATPVGSCPAGASPYGALDMAGNLWEWVEDWYSDAYYASSPRVNPRGPSAGAFRACRGGSWNSPAADIRVTTRGMNDPSHCDGLVGIRCACSAGQC